MKIPCSNCNQRLEIPEELAGQTIECPACNASLAVPTLEATLQVQITPPKAVSLQTPAPQKRKSSIPSKTTPHNDVTKNLASRWKRLGGILIDSLISLIIVCPIMFTTGVFQQLADGRQMTIGQAAFYFIIGWVLFLIFHGYLLFTRGQTIGKVLVQTKIVDLNGNLPNFGKLLFLRYLVLGIIYQIPILGSIASIANALFIFGGERRCIHDYLAGTRVIDV